MTTVADAYADVERVTRERARNFAYGIMLLPKPKRQAIAAIYAFAREVDDIADDPELDNDVKRERLEELREALDGAGTAAMFVALSDARRRYPIPATSLHDLIDGGLQDTQQTRYATFGELAGYCRRVAGAVGIACVAVYGADGREAPVREADQGRGVPGGTGRGFPPQRSGDAYRLAETLGVALQLINIIRDVAEDWGLGRVYLPQDELARFGVSEEDIEAGRCTDEWRALMAHQAARARAQLAEGRTLLPRLDRRSRACVATFANLYSATLDRIEALGYDVFDGPAQLSTFTKLRIVGAGLTR
jgi:15-cis-phytoene synthase